MIDVTDVLDILHTGIQYVWDNGLCSAPNGPYRLERRIIGRRESTGSCWPIPIECHNRWSNIKHVQHRQLADDYRESTNDYIMPIPTH